MTTRHSPEPSQTATQPVLKSRMPATCNHCAWQGNRSTAGLHERYFPTHQATVWDSPTSQLPRALWATPVTFPHAS